MSLMLINPEENTLKFAGANRPLFLIREKKRPKDPDMESFLVTQTDAFAAVAAAVVRAGRAARATYAILDLLDRCGARATASA